MPPFDLSPSMNIVYGRESPAGVSTAVHPNRFV